MSLHALRSVLPEEYAEGRYFESCGGRPITLIDRTRPSRPRDTIQPALFLLPLGRLCGQCSTSSTRLSGRE